VRVEGVSESEVSRKHALFDHERREGVAGVLSVVGGKITAYSAIAEEVTDLVARKLGAPRVPSRTAELPLPGAEGADLAPRASGPGLPGRQSLAHGRTPRLGCRAPHGGGRRLPSRDRAHAALQHGMRAILALDQGTTGSSAMVFDEAGAALGSSDREIAQHYPAPGHVEHDADEIFATTVAVGREALAAAGVDARDVA